MSNSATQSFESLVSSITIAILRDQFEDMKVLCEQVFARFDTDTDSKHRRNFLKTPLECAAEYGRVECLKYLIDFSNIKDSKALEYALYEKHPACVSALIPHYDPTHFGNLMVQAAHHDKWTIVAQMADLADPQDTEKFQTVLLHASKCKKETIVVDFYTRCDPEQALKHAKNEIYFNKKDIEILVAYHSTEAQRVRIARSVEDLSLVDKRKSKM